MRYNGIVPMRYTKGENDMLNKSLRWLSDEELLEELEKASEKVGDWDEKPEDVKRYELLYAEGYDHNGNDDHNEGKQEQHGDKKER